MSPERIPTETSPLLGPQANGHAPHHTTGAISNGHPRSSESVERDHGTEEAQVDKDIAHSRNALKYIVPAISIGVWVVSRLASESYLTVTDSCNQIFLSAADQTIIMASYGQIGSDLEALNLTSWIATSYFLTLTSFQPLYGKLSDIFGRKSCLLFAYGVFGIGCLCCGLAQNIHELIAARVRPMLLCNTLLIIPGFPRHRRGWYDYCR